MVTACMYVLLLSFSSTKVMHDSAHGSLFPATWNKELFQENLCLDLSFQRASWIKMIGCTYPKNQYRQPFLLQSSSVPQHLWAPSYSSSFSYLKGWSTIGITATTMGISLVTKQAILSTSIQSYRTKILVLLSVTMHTCKLGGETVFNWIILLTIILLVTFNKCVRVIKKKRCDLISSLRINRMHSTKGSVSAQWLLPLHGPNIAITCYWSVGRAQGKKFEIVFQNK